MNAFGSGALVLVLLVAAPARSDEHRFVLLVPAASVPAEDAKVSAESAFGVACSYGLDPAVGQISVQLCSDHEYGLHWYVGYVDWSAVHGTSGFSIDAATGVVVGRMATMGAHDKKRLEYEIDTSEAESDKSPPPRPDVRFVGASRGYYPKRECLLRVDVENARQGRIWAHFRQISDDRTPRGEMGFVLEQIGGAQPLPDSWGPRVPYYPQIKFHPDSLMAFIYWDDGNDDVQEPVSTRFAVYAVDRGGNRSASPDTLVVELPGG